MAENVECKASVVVEIGYHLVSAKKLDAVKIIKEIVAPLIKGGGGGQKTLAAAGGQDVSALGELIEKVRKTL